MDYKNDINDYIYNIAKETGEIDGELIYSIVSQLDYEDESQVIYEILDYLKKRNIKIEDTLTEEFECPISTDDWVKDYFHQISCFDLLTYEDECELSKKIIDRNKAIENKEYISNELLDDIIQLGDLAAEKMINHNLRLVVNVAKRYLNPDIDIMDLIQEGNMGLVEAVNRYDYSLGYRFSTYAYNWIRQSISRYVRNNKNIRLPMNVQNDLSIIRKKVIELSLEEENSNDRISKLSISLGGRFTEKRIRELLAINTYTISLDSSISKTEDSRELHETIADESIENNNLKFDYPVGWEKLSEKEKDIFIMFYIDKVSLDEIGKKYGVSGGRIRQIKDRAKRILEFYGKLNNNI